ncbi:MULTISPECIES: hypothetical protein [unclassified Streptomyces]|uniref:hypothetical protein n=1 Tax=unclassified Streptomyces TaxID=2593676 RepID=UPI002E1520DF|nr:hypothetical protein OG452_22550 [Streptomyces sp. NBC_01197]WSS49419.1 hypothetical protein OG708_12715 [Streptomyces sp. NBC_01180]
MPGQQRKRRNQQRGGPLRGAGAGRWEVVFETQDAAEWQSSVPRIRSELGLTDASMLRVETLGSRGHGPGRGHAEQPVTYRLSMFVPYPQAERQTAPGPAIEPPGEPNG